LRWDPRYVRRAFQDSSLVRLRDAFRNVNIDSLIERAERQVSNGTVWATIQERDLVPEGTAWDPRTRSLLIGSLHRNKVVAIASDGTVSDRVARNSNGLGSVVGIHVDTIRGILWVASDPRFDVPDDTATPALFAFDSRTGAFRRRINSPARGAFLNDLTTGPDGAVYVTDTRGGHVFVLRPGSDVLVPFEAAGTVISPNGITVSPDGRHLLVADTDHIKVTTLPAGPTRRLAVPDSINVASLDGLAMTGTTLIAHHPLSYWRIATYSVDAGLTRIVRTDFIERNTPDSRTSTTGEIGGDFYYFIGNSQIDRMNSRTIDPASMEPIRIYRVPRSALR
jgi:sugar lactone lactonase YvrE